MKDLQKELDLTTDEIIAATTFNQQCIDLYSDTYETTPEYDEMLSDFGIEIFGLGEYDYEFSDEFAVYATTGKMPKDLKEFLDALISTTNFMNNDDDDDE